MMLVIMLAGIGLMAGIATVGLLLIWEESYIEGTLLCITVYVLRAIIDVFVEVNALAIWT